MRVSVQLWNRMKGALAGTAVGVVSRLLAFVGIAALGFGPGRIQASQPVLAPINPEFLAWQASKGKIAAAASALASPRPAEAVGSEDANTFGYVPSPVNLSHIRGSVFSSNARFARMGAGFPSRFDLRDTGAVTEVRDQYPFGTCWAHGAIASLESSELKGGRPSADLSEWHLAYFAYNNVPSGSVSFTKRVSNLFGPDLTFDQGGNNLQSTALLARGTGAVLESAAPYQHTSPYPASALPKGSEPNRIRLHESLYLGADFESSDAKAALMEHGALSIAVWWNNGSFDSAHNTYRYTGGGANHIVNIVGWDDEFLASNFPVGNRPSSNGAWIVRNSWGSSWGDNGYFYLSYDSRISDGVAFVSSPIQVTRTYQYDPLGWVSSIGDGYSDTAWFGNVFTAQATEPIGAVSFYSAAPNAEYEISIRTKVTSTSPGVLAGPPQSGVLDAPGYRTVYLDQPITIPSGTRFGVSIKLRTPGYDKPIPVEMRLSEYSEKATGGSGQSYFCFDGDSWQDLAYYMTGANVCVKALVTLNPISITAKSPVTAGKGGWTASVPARPGCSYLWTISGGTITAGVGTRSITYTAGAGASVTLNCTVKHSLGATVSDSVTVEVIDAPIATISAPSPVTTGDTGLSASVLTQENTGYLWSITGGTLSEPRTEPSVTFSVGASGTATLKCAVTNEAGTTITGTKAISVLAKPTATISATTTVTAGTTALNASVPLQSGCAYSWTITGDGTITSVTNKNTITFNAGSSNFVIHCTVTNAAGYAAEGTREIKVVPAPIADIMTTDAPVITGTAGHVASVVFQEGSTYTWALTGATVTSGAGTPAITFKAGVVGKATLKCTVKNAAGKTITGARTVTIVANGAVIVAASPVTTGLSGQEASVPEGAASYSWGMTGGTIDSGQTSNRISYTAGGVGTATLTCTVNSTNTGSKAITIIPAPTAVISGSAPVTAGIGGWKVSVPAQAGCTYAWKVVGGAITAGSGTNTITYKPSGGAGSTVTIDCIVKNAAGTTDTKSWMSGVVTAPVAAITAESPVIALTPNLTAAVPDQDGTFLWTITGGTLTSLNTTSTVTYTAGAAGTTTLKCTVKNPAGTAATGTKALTVIAKPLATVTGASTVTTGDENLVLSVPAQTGCTYAWQTISGTSTGGSFTSPTNSNSVTYKAGSTGTMVLSCLVTAAGGSTTTGSKTVNVVAVPDATIQAATPVTEKKTGLAASVPVQTGCTFAWTLKGGAITAGAGTRSITYTAGSSGSATLACTVKNAAGKSAMTEFPITILAVPNATITTESPVITLTPGLLASVPDQAGTFAWSIKGGTLAEPITERTVSYTAGAAGTATLTCRVTNGALTSVTGSKAVTVMAKPVSTITAASSVTSGHTGLAASVPLQMGCTYKWSAVNATIESDDTERSITYKAGNAGTCVLTCVVTSSASMTSTGTKTITVIAAPDATITATSPVTTGTSGWQAFVQAQTGCSYSWQIIGGTITTGVGTRTIAYAVTAAAGDNLVLTCKVRNAIGAEDIKSVMIGVVNKPAVPIITAPSPIISWKTGFTASVPDQTDCTYNWSLTGGEVTGGNGTPIISYNSGSTGIASLTCTVTNAAGTSVSGTKSIQIARCLVSTVLVMNKNNRVYDPNYVTVDSSGDIFVSDRQFDGVWKIAPDGSSTILSMYQSGQYNQILNGVATDSSGNLYVGDWWNQMVYKRASSGTVSIFRYSSVLNPNGIATDSFGNVYIANDGSPLIYKVTPGGDTTEIAVVSAPLNRAVYPAGIVVDPVGNIYVATYDNCQILKITPAGVVTTVAGKAWTPGYVDGSGMAARFDYPCGIALDQGGNLYVADVNNACIRKITPDGRVTTLAGKAGSRGFLDGPPETARFGAAYGVAIDNDGNVIVADSTNSAIRKITQ